MWAAVKTAAAVAVVTLLVWLWAEAETLTTAVVTPRIELEVTPDRYARFVDQGWTGIARVRLRGSTLAIERAQRHLAAPVRVMPGAGALSAEPGEREVNLAEVLRQDPALPSMGVSIDEVDPPIARVRVEPLLVRTVSVRVETGAIEIEGEPVIEPVQVSVRLLEADAGRLEPPSAATVAIAALEPADLARLPEGESGTVRVRVQAPRALAGLEAVALTPAEVAVTLKPRSRELTWFVPEAPVSLVLPADAAAGYDVELLDAAVKDVRVTGPRPLILDLQRRGESPRALVVLSREDLEQRVARKPAVFGLTPSLLRFDTPGGTPEIRLRISPRR